MEFPSLTKDYKASKIFPLFHNRVMNSKRPEFAAHLHNLGLTEDANPVEILAINGGRRVTDAYEVFPKIEKTANGTFTCRFFLRGWRHVNQSALERIKQLKEKNNCISHWKLQIPQPSVRCKFRRWITT